MAQHDDPANGTTGGDDELAALLAERDALVAERDALRERVALLGEELDGLKNGVLREWLLAANRESSTLHQMTQTLSWRITKPLRLVRQFQLAAAERGFAEAARAASRVLGDRIRR